MIRSKFRQITQDRKAVLDHRGFTLAEMLVALAVASVVLAAAFIIFRDYSRSNSIQIVSAEIQQDLRAGFSFMEREIRNAGLNPKEVSGAGITSADVNTITFTADLDFNGFVAQTDPSTGIPAATASPDEQITYTYNAATNQISRQNLASTDVLLNNVSACTFSYFDTPTNQLATPVAQASLEDIRSIVIDITLTASAGGNNTVSRRMQTRVFCRNLNL